MIFLKAATVIIVGIVTVLAIRRMMGSLTVEKVKVKTEPRRPIRLRRDPRTGVYYPED